MIDTVLNSLTDALNAADVSAVRKFPQKKLLNNTVSMPNLKLGENPIDFIVCVGVLSSRTLSSAFGDYLGIATDPDTLLDYEVYAFRLEMDICLDIFSHFGSEPLSYFDRLSRSLTQLPLGLRIIELQCGNTQPDKDTELLKTPVTLKCSAYLTARADEDSGSFSDFVLKGVLNNDAQ